MLDLLGLIEWSDQTVTPYKNDTWKIKNSYLLKEFSDRFGGFGKVVGVYKDYSKSPNFLINFKK